MSKMAPRPRLTRRMLAMIVLCAGACALPVCGEGARPYRGKVFLGLGTETVSLSADKRYQSSHGLLVNRVAVASSAEKAGIRVGDILASIDGATWTNDQIRLSRSFGKAGDKSRPGDVADCVVVRSDPADPDAPPRVETVRIVLQPYPGTQAEAGGTPGNDVIRPDLASAPLPAWEPLCRGIITHAGFDADCADLLARLARAEEYPDVHRLPIVRYVKRDPFKLEVVARELTAPITARREIGSAHTGELLAVAEKALLRFHAAAAPREDSIPGIAAGLPAYADGDLNAHLAFTAAVLNAAAEWNRKALRNLSEEDVDFALKTRGRMLDAFIEHKMLSYDVDVQRQGDAFRLILLAAKVDRQALLVQARVAALLAAPEFVASLAKAAAAEKDVTGADVASRDTPHGRILVAGKARNRHTGDAAVLYDLGGDDVYANNQAASIPGSIPSALVIDYEGDDAYETYAPFSQGCGDLGVGVLVDLQGDDHYIGTRFTQGAGFMGVGMLIDEAGDDTYRGHAFHQGVGHFGVGVLVDSRGSDAYHAHSASQGVGLPGGCGLLYDGGSQGDRYYCKGNKPSGYGTAGVFEGWGQAMGFGYRPYASGGVGVLYDEGGSDRMEAGNFSQGGGYYYGFGFLHAAGPEDDHYIGSRYAQGFGVHQASGTFIEEGGNDRYSTRYCVAQGLAWDEATGLFLETAGDDRYEGGGFSQGASAMNGWTLFVDLAGDDTYLYTDQARAGGNSYHGGTSLSFFVDAGGGDDRYHQNKGNDAVITGGEKSIFADLPGTIEEALAGKAWEKLVREPRSP